MSQHTLGVNLCCSLLTVHLSRCKSGTTPLLSTELHQRKKEGVRGLNGRRSIMFYILNKTLHVVIGSQKHECFMCYLLNHTSCPNTKTTEKGDKSLPYKCKPTCFWSPPRAYTNTHTTFVKGIRWKRKWKKEKEKKKTLKRVQDRALRCIAGKEIKSTHPGLPFLEIHRSVLSASFMPGQSDGSTEHLL